MRIICGLTFVLLLCCWLPTRAQQSDSVAIQPATANYSASSIDLSPQELKEVMRRQAFARKQRVRELRFEHSLSKYFPQHDMRLMLGFFPIQNSWRGENANYIDWYNPAYEVIGVKYDESTLGRHCLASLSVTYAYWVSRRWEVGVGLSYTGYRNTLTSRVPGVAEAKYREHHFSVMPLVRYAWIARRSVRLYSSVEFGAQVTTRRQFFEQDSRVKIVGGGQFVAVGLTAGRRCFFCCEVGTGWRGILNVGVGWRLDAKSEKR